MKRTPKSKKPVAKKVVKNSRHNLKDVDSEPLVQVQSLPPEPAVSLPAAAKEEIKAVVEKVKSETFAETPMNREERLISATVKAIMGEAMPAMMAAFSQSNQSANTRAVEQHKRRVHCNICLQSGYKEPPCKAEGHMKMVVYPQKYPEFGKWFQGAIINGVRYLSSNRRETVTIPKACEAQIVRLVTDYEENERATRLGRSYDHDSGGIGVGATGAKQANAAWR